jgi:hypothetical protein
MRRMTQAALPARSPPGPGGGTLGLSGLTETEAKRHKKKHKPTKPHHPAAPPAAPPASPSPPGCQPQSKGQRCGDDGCGGACGWPVSVGAAIAPGYHLSRTVAGGRQNAQGTGVGGNAEEKMRTVVSSAYGINLVAKFMKLAFQFNEITRICRMLIGVPPICAYIH